jgi:hypothetical protein
MNGARLITALKRKFRVATDVALAKHLGVSIPAIQIWKNQRALTARQVAGLIHKASFQSNVIRPVVEFFPIERCKTRNGAAFEVFSTDDGNRNSHPYRLGLKNELLKHTGVYVFFDSRGRAIYAGRARRQKLWKEINLAFNRYRGNVQNIRRVKHPTQRRAYQTAEEKRRQIVEFEVELHVLAAYFSAYHVADAMINDLESLLVRSFANDLLNVRMENFGH